jgi:phage FluMu protein Com
MPTLHHSQSVSQSVSYVTMPFRLFCRHVTTMYKCPHCTTVSQSVSQSVSQLHNYAIQTILSTCYNNVQMPTLHHSQSVSYIIMPFRLFCRHVTTMHKCPHCTTVSQLVSYIIMPFRLFCRHVTTMYKCPHCTTVSQSVT